MNSHRGSYVAEAARSTGHGDGGARGRVRREGARRRATRERTVADRNGRRLPPARRRRDLGGVGGSARTHPTPRTRTGRRVRSRPPRRRSGARDRGATRARAARRPRRRRGARSRRPTARRARPRPRRPRARARARARAVRCRGARRARGAARRARAARSAWSARGERGETGRGEAPRSITWRAGASSGIVGRRGRRRARVCSPRARARGTREARVPSSARVRVRARDRGSDETLARVASLGKPARRPPPRRVDGAHFLNPHVWINLSDSCTPHVKTDGSVCGKI